MAAWNMLTLVGADRPSIVAQVTHTLYQLGGNLGEASMIRLGGNFTIMLMVSGDLSTEAMLAALAPVSTALGLRVHVDPVHGELHQHQVPNFQVRVNGADRAGIVAEVTAILATQGFNILELDSDVAGDLAQPLYLMNIQGFCAAPLEALETALAPLIAQGVAVTVAPLELMIG
ncbi:glycine cleavage system protein R [Chromatium okenii]|uniref:glycine cleavage system protein R n=1 Tax=Chromatium okenii TaxID=61644 RepID=UPI0026ECB612|nr:ACT domain-containing protein [Chromatium okenii]MBV5307946.1 amino acid-binding protein [Chromatium okenii]